MFSTWLHFTLHLESRLNDFRFANPSRGVNSTLIDSIFMIWSDLNLSHSRLVPSWGRLDPSYGPLHWKKIYGAYLCESESNPYMKSHFWKRINAFSTLCAEKCFKVGIKFIVDKDNTGKQIDKNLFNTVLLKSFHPYCIVPIKILGTKGTEIVRKPEHSKLIIVWTPPAGY